MFGAGLDGFLHSGLFFVCYNKPIKDTEHLAEAINAVISCHIMLSYKNKQYKQDDDYDHVWK